VSALTTAELHDRSAEQFLGDDTPAIVTTGLTKRFGSVAVVDQLALEVPAGSVFGFLGPNGSGKTTTIRMLLGLISPSAGEVELFGRRMPGAADDVLPQIGALVEGPACYPWLTGKQNLERIDAAGPHGDRPTRPARVGLALERVGLTAAQDKKFKAYSLGMRQRLGLASALLRPRRMLILDEPTNGMDPQGTREIRHLIRELAADGTTVFLSSHLLAEIEQVCTHVAMMRLGRLVTQGSLAALQGANAARVEVQTDDLAVAVGILRSLGLAAEVVEGTVRADLGDRRPEDLAHALVTGGVGLRGFAIERPSLEDTFVSLTGEGFDVAR
jgi:ABC-2 type transport system ATP-binding protein